MTPTPTSRKGKTKIEIALEAQQREEAAVGLRALNYSYEAIARELGWTDGSAARKAIQRCLDRHEEANVDDLRRVENSKIDMLEARCVSVLNKRWMKVDHGKVVYSPVLNEDGTPEILEDPMPHLAAVREMRQLLTRRAALRGLDAPLRKIIEVITDDAVDAEIRRLEAMMEELSGIEQS